MASLWNICIDFTMNTWYFWWISKGFKLSFIARTSRWVETSPSSNLGDRTAVSAGLTLPISCSDLLFGGRRWWVIPGRCPRLTRHRLWVIEGKGGKMWGRNKETLNFLQTLVFLACFHTFLRWQRTQCPASRNYMKGVSWNPRQLHLIFAESSSATGPFSERLFLDHQAPQFLFTAVLAEHSDRATASAQHFFYPMQTKNFHIKNISAGNGIKVTGTPGEQG